MLCGQDEAIEVGMEAKFTDSDEMGGTASVCIYKFAVWNDGYLKFDLKSPKLQAITVVDKNAKVKSSVIAKKQNYVEALTTDVAYLISLDGYEYTV